MFGGDAYARVLARGGRTGNCSGLGWRRLCLPDLVVFQMLQGKVVEPL